MCLPGVLLALWYGWSAYAQLDRYRRAVRQKAPFELETLHIALYDRLETDLRRMWMAPPPTPSRLDSYVLHLTRQGYSTLEESGARSQDRPYVDAKVEHDGRVLDGKVRLRGGRHWHVEGAQKSLKVKLDKGELIEGHRVFNLINDPTPLVIGEQLIQDLAREEGLLTPVSDFVRLKINSKDFGVFHYETAADESLLRTSRRLPGSIYASELPDAAGAEELWSNPLHWTKVASRTDSDADKTDRADLERLLQHVRNGTTRDFYDFSRHELNLEAFAELDALDVAFGGDQRDFRENHSYYFDPYRGSWEPLAGQFRGFRDDPLFNLVDNPVLLRLKMTPGYLSLRDRRLYAFLTGKGAPAALRARAKRLLERLAPELATDPYWDAYRQLPRIDAFHRRMVRPNSLRRLALVVESEFTTYSHRHAQLVSELERNPLFLQLGAPVARAGAGANGAGPEFRTPFLLLVDGHAGVALNELSVSFRDDCENPSIRLFRSGVELPTHGSAGHVELDTELALYPSIAIVARANPSPRRGRVRGAEIPVDYPLELGSRCAPEHVLARGRHLATDSRVVSRPAPSELLARLPARRLGPADTPAFAVGEAAPHPWQLESPPRREVQLGPGELRIEATRVFEANETVTVQPGTRLRMGPGASLVFLGKVRFLGQRDAPIVLSALGDQPWGGVALQGPGTQGSEWHSVQLSGGTRPSFRSTDYPALVDVHDSSNILLDNCQFSAHASKHDTLHFAYVRAGEIRDSTFRGGPGDAVDLEYSSVELRLVQIVAAGDDGLDLMGSQVELRDSVILGANGNGISSGEESRVDIQNSLIADCKVGVLVKNAAYVALSGSLLFRNATGVRTYQRTVRYAGPSEVTANVLFVVGSSGNAVQRDDRPQNTLDQGRILLDLPQRGALDHVLEDVLELSDWQELPRWISDQKGQAIR
jgi:CotH kinase protein/Right handed beta helix region